MRKTYYKLHKQIIASILAVCMVVGFFPARAVTPAELWKNNIEQMAKPMLFKDISGTPIVNKPILNYNYFKCKSGAGNVGTKVDTVTDYAYTTMGSGKELYPTLKVPTDPWIYGGVSKNGSTATGRILWIGIAYGLLMDTLPTGPSSGYWGAMRIQVPEDGTYRVVSQNGHWASGGVVRMFIAPVTATNPLAPEYSVGAVDSFLKSGNDWTKKNKLQAVTLSKGEHIVTYQLVGTNREKAALRDASDAGNKAYREDRFAFSALLLEPIDGMPDMRLDIKESGVIREGKSGSAVLCGLRGTGENVISEDLFQYDISAVSHDESIAKVQVGMDEENMRKELVIQGGKKGTAPIDITLKSPDNKEIKYTYLADVAGEQDSLKSVTMTFPKEILEVDTTMKAEVSGVALDGNGADLSSAMLTFGSSNPAVATVDEHGMITAQAEGTADITATIRLDGTKKTATKTITVKDSSVLESVKVLSSMGDQLNGWTSTQLSVNGTMSSGKVANFVGAEISYAIISGDAVSLTKEGLVTVEKKGDVTIEATVTLKGTTVKNSIVLHADPGESAPPNKVFDFKSGSKYPDGSLARDIKIANEGWEINHNLTSQFLLTQKDRTRFQIYGISCEVQAMNNPPESDTAIDFMIDYPGNYTFNFCGGGYGSGGVAAMYIDGVYVGEYNFYGKGLKEKAYVDLRSVLLSKGKHTLLLRTIGRDPSGGGGLCQYIGCLTFKGLQQLPTPEKLIANVESTSLAIGDTGKITVNVKDSNGAEYPVHPNLPGVPDNNMDLRFESLSPDVLDVDANGNVTAKSAGEAKVKISADINGTALESIVVYSVSKLRKKVYDFKSGSKYAEGSLARDIKIADAGWEINRNLTSQFLLTQKDRTRFQIYGISCEVQAMNNAPESDTAIDFMIDNSAKYTFNFCGGGYNSGGVSAMYIDGVYAGEYNFYGNGGALKEKEYVDLRSLYLQKGKHTLIVRTISKDPSGAGGTAQYIGCLIFNEIAEFPEITDLFAEVDKEDLPIGGKTKIKSITKMSNGAKYPVLPNLDGIAQENMGIQYKSLTPNIIDIDENGVITAKAAGKGSVEVTATIDGKTKTAVTTVYIYKNSLDDATISLSTDQIYVDSSAKIQISGFMTDGTVVAGKDFEVTCQIENPEIANVSEKDGIYNIIGLKEGKTTLTVTAKYLGFEPKTAIIPINVVKEQFAKLRFQPSAVYLKPDGNTAEIKVFGEKNTGETVDLTGAVITYESRDESVALVNNKGMVISTGEGKTTIGVSATKDGIAITGEVLVIVTNGKAGRTFYTDDKVAAARENSKKYAWARSLKENAIKDADKYLDLDRMWDLVTTQELPRSITVGFQGDPDAYKCRYCNANLLKQYFAYPWICDPINNPWKIKCPNCRREFPSNNFGRFYESGLDENGIFRYEQAKQNGKQYLVNVLYPEKGEGWGVDDGYGYKPGNVYKNGVVESHTYIAYYNHFGLWYPYSGPGNVGTITTALKNLRDAYLYTGEARYGRAGAILIDRVADVYPDMDISPFAKDTTQKMFNSHGGGYQGKIIGCIWEAETLSRVFSEAYDAFFPAMDDPKVISFLSDKAQKYKLENKKDSGAAIRKNCEDGILRNVFSGCKDGEINGNFGMEQSALATAAVVLDNMPETSEWIDWTMKAGKRVSYTEVSGGNVMPQLVNTIDYNGHGGESAPGYNAHWVEDTLKIAEVLYGYNTYPVDLYQNTKFLSMFTAMLPLTSCGKNTAQIGDSGSTASTGFAMNLDCILLGFQRTGDKRLAQAAYMLNNNSAEGLHANIFIKDPERIAKDIHDIVKEEGTLGMKKSENIAGYGFAILRDGNYLPAQDQIQTIDTQRDFWMKYGQTYPSHAHLDMLNLGMSAYGLNMAPDLGYPESTGVTANRMEWVRNTISHNTVVVDNKGQSTIKTNGKPMHFDDSGRVKVMDIDAPESYGGVTSTYRRTVVMVEASDEVSYGLDFFHVIGGTDHLYSFHSLSDEIKETEGLTFTEQKAPALNEKGEPIKDAQGNAVMEFKGSYAGIDIPWGAGASIGQSGYNWLKNVRRADKPNIKNFAVDFKVKDFRKTLKKQSNLHLRLTMLNDFNIDEVSLAKGVPPRVKSNIMVGDLEYLLARRKSIDGRSLNTLFTTVLEPYNEKRYIKSLENVPADVLEGAESRSDVVRAIKVTMEDGRVDYVVYANNNKVKYRIDNQFDFRGFVGVYTLNNGANSYSYLNDGDLIGESANITNAYTGKIYDFTKELILDNTITVTLNEKDADVNNLVGRSIFIDNDNKQNAVYQIQRAEVGPMGTIILHLGSQTLIRSYKDEKDIKNGYIYNVEVGARFKIPLSAVNDTGLIFNPIGDQRAEAGNELRFRVSAQSNTAGPLIYSAKALPRGAQFDAKTQTFIWLPDKSQQGINRVGFEVTDGINTAAIWVPIQVYAYTGGGNSTTGTQKPNQQEPHETNSSTGESKVDAKLDNGKAIVTPKKEDVLKAQNPVIHVPEVSGAKGYEVKLPAAVFDRKIIINTPSGNLELPANMMKADGEITVGIMSGNSIEISIQVNGKDYLWKNTSDLVKITAPYTPDQNMVNPECIIVKDDNGDIIPSAKYENGNIILYANKLGERYKVDYNPKSFCDLDKHMWASDAITSLAAREIINGTGKNTYSPEKNITRADFITLVVRALRLNADVKENFADVSETDYYAKQVGIAKSLGIVDGQGDNKYNPKSQISREDMMVIVSRALNKAGYELKSGDISKFCDAKSVSKYAEDSIGSLTSSGIITGTDGKIIPKGKTTRAEVAVLLFRVVFMNPSTVCYS